MHVRFEIEGLLKRMRYGEDEMSGQIGRARKRHTVAQERVRSMVEVDKKLAEVRGEVQ